MVNARIACARGRPRRRLSAAALAALLAAGGCNWPFDGRCLNSTRGVSLEGRVAAAGGAQAGAAWLSIVENRSGGGPVRSYQALGWTVLGTQAGGAVTAVHVHVGEPVGPAARVLLTLPARSPGVYAGPDTLLAFGRYQVSPGQPLFPGAPAFDTLRRVLQQGPVYLDVHTADAPAGFVGGRLARDPDGATADWSRANCS